jgi:hypothetical protein
MIKKPSPLKMLRIKLKIPLRQSIVKSKTRIKYSMETKKMKRITILPLSILDLHQPPPVKLHALVDNQSHPTVWVSILEAKA